MDVGMGYINAFALRVWDSACRSRLQPGTPAFHLTCQSTIRNALSDLGRNGHTFCGGESLMGIRVVIRGRGSVVLETLDGARREDCENRFDGVYLTRPVEVEVTRQGEDYAVVHPNGTAEIMPLSELQRRFTAAM